MANTMKKYLPLDSSGNDYAALKGITGIEQAALSAAQNSWKAASDAGDQAGMDAAHKQAETIRRKYGYSGGQDGSQYLPMAGYSGPAAPTYTDRFDGRKQQLLDTIMNREKFSYDAEKDPLYQQYAAMYQREGGKAMQDTLAQISARTGGLASSYAGQAAQQTYNGFMEKLTDKVPELYELAYNMYLKDFEQDVDKLGLLRTAEQDDYSKFRDALSQFNTDRTFGYGKFRDEVADERYDSEQAQSLAETRAKLLAAAGDYSGYRALGLSDADVSKLQAAALAQQGTGRAGGGGSVVSGGGDYDLEGLFRAAYESGNPYTFLKQSGNYKKYGLNSAPVNSEYDAWLEQQSQEPDNGLTGTARYGSNYSGIYRNARRMYDQGKSQNEIIAYLDGVDTGITEEGMANILYTLGLAVRPK